MTTVQDKQLVDNVIKHATTHNRVIEEEACWRQILHRRNERGKSASSISSSSVSRDSLRRTATRERRSASRGSSASSWSKVSRRSPRSANAAATQQALDAYERELRHQAKKEIEIAAAQKLPGVAVPHVELTDRWGHDGWEALQRPGPPAPVPTLGARMRPASYRLMPLVQRTIENPVRTKSQSSDLSDQSSVRKKHKSKRSRKSKKRKYRRRDDDSDSDSPSSRSRSPSSGASSSEGDSDDKRSNRKKRKKHRKEKKRRKRYGKRRGRKTRRRKHYSSSSSRSSSSSSSSGGSRSRTRSRTRRSGTSAGSRSRSSRSCSCCDHSGSRSGSYSSRSRSFSSRSRSTRGSHNRRRSSSASSFDSQKVGSAGTVNPPSREQTATEVRPPSDHKGGRSPLNETSECASAGQTPVSRASPFPESDRELPSDISESGRRTINGISSQQELNRPSPLPASRQSSDQEAMQDDQSNHSAFESDFPDTAEPIRGDNLQEGHVQVYPDESLDRCSPAKSKHHNEADELYDPVLAVSDTPSQSAHEESGEEEIACPADDVHVTVDQMSNVMDVSNVTSPPKLNSPPQPPCEYTSHQDSLDIHVDHQSPSLLASSIPLPTPKQTGRESVGKPSHSDFDDDIEGVPLDLICVPPDRPNTPPPPLPSKRDAPPPLVGYNNFDDIPLDSICIPPMPSPKLPDETKAVKPPSSTFTHSEDVPLDSICIPPIPLPDDKETANQRQRVVSRPADSPEPRLQRHRRRQTSDSPSSGSSTSSGTTDNRRAAATRPRRTSSVSTQGRAAKKAHRRRRSTPSPSRKNKRRSRKHRSDSSDSSSSSRSPIHQSASRHPDSLDERDSSAGRRNSSPQAARDIQVGGKFGNRLPESSEERQSPLARYNVTESVDKHAKKRRNRRGSASSQEPRPQIANYQPGVPLEPNEVNQRRSDRAHASIKESIPSGPSVTKSSAAHQRDTRHDIGSLESKRKRNKVNRNKAESFEEGEVSSSPSPVRHEQPPPKSKTNAYDNQGFRSHNKHFSGPITISPFKVFSRQQKMTMQQAGPTPTPNAAKVATEPPQPSAANLSLSKGKTKRHRRRDSAGSGSGVNEAPPAPVVGKKKRHRKRHEEVERELAVPCSVAELPITKVNQWQEASMRMPPSDAGRYEVEQSRHFPNPVEMESSSKKHRSNGAKDRDFEPVVSTHQPPYPDEAHKHHSSVSKKKKRKRSREAHPSEMVSSYQPYNAPEAVGQQPATAKSEFHSRSKHEKHQTTVSPATALPPGKFVHKRHAVILSDIPTVTPVKTKSKRHQGNDLAEISVRHPIAPLPSTVEEKVAKNKKGRDKRSQQAHLPSPSPKRRPRQQSSDSSSGSASDSSGDSSGSDSQPELTLVPDKPGKKPRNKPAADAGRQYYTNGLAAGQQPVASKKQRQKLEQSRAKKSKRRSAKLSAKQLAELNEEIKALISKRMLAGRRKAGRKRKQPSTSSSSSGSTSESSASDGGISSLQSDEEIAWKEPS